MLRRYLLTLIFTAFCFTLYAQEFKLGRVTIDELKEKAHPADTSAPAAILYKKGRTYFMLYDGHFNMVTEVEFRIKIYKKTGYDYATQKLPYYTGGRSIFVDFSDACTYNLENGQIVKTKMKSDGDFTEKINDDFSVKKIVLPNVKEGSVIEYSYKIRTPYYGVIPDWRFQYSIPVNNVEYFVATPQYFTYNTYLIGYLPINATQPKTKAGSGSAFTESYVVYSAKDVPALKDEDFVNNINNYTSTLKMELAMVQIPGQAPEKLSMDWTSLTAWIYDNKDFGGELKARSYFEDDLPAILAGKVSTTDKVNAVFKYVQERMKWDEEESYFCEKGVKKAYNDKTGNSAEINLMLVAMLRQAGLSANPVLVSTRDNGIALYPNRAAYNYVIAAVENDNKVVLLDATSKNTVPGLLPVRALNWLGRMIRPDGSSAEVDLMPKTNAKETISVAATIDNTGKVNGKARDQYFDNFGYAFRERFSNISKESYLEYMEKQNKGLTISDYKVDNVKEPAKPLMEEYAFEHSAAADAVGDKIFFNPLLFLADDENPFKQEKREYPVDFMFPQQIRYNVNVTIPQGYTIESMPKPALIKMEDGLGSFRYNVQSVGSQVQLLAVYEMNNAALPPDYYPTLRDFYMKMIEKQQEKVVLKKL